MKRKIIITLIILAVAASLFSVWERYQIERNNSNLELVMDGNYLFQLQDKIDVEKGEILSRYRNSGLTGVSIYQDRVRNIINEKKGRLITGNEIARMKQLSAGVNPLFSNFSYTEKSAFLFVSDQEMIKRLLSYLPRWKEDYDFNYLITGTGLIVFVPEWEPRFLNLSIGFSDKNINEIKEAGLKIIPRLRNDLEGYSEWSFINKFKPDYVIFSGIEIMGYPENISNTAHVMSQNNIKFGMIEPFIAYQKGANKLARELDFNLHRVHSIQQGEMDYYEPDRIIDRYLRAVRVRDVRILYLKPFLEEGDDRGLLAKNLDFINNLKKKLKADGYALGNAVPFAHFSSHFLLLMLTGLGIIGGGILLLEHILSRRLGKATWILLILGLGGELILYLKGYGILTRQVLALGAAIIYPGLAIISQLLNKDSDTHWLRAFLRTTIVSLLGGLFLISALADISFVLKVEQFRGVKFAFVLPLVIISFYYFRQILTDYSRPTFNDIRDSIKDLLEKEIKVKHLVLLAFLAFGGFVYLGRTGNFPLLPVPSWEINFRSFLEDLLYVRPRFKEFLLGHPFLVLTLALRDRIGSKLYFYPLLLLASIGQITILNTFSHIHTPVVISIIRIFNGLWLGLLLGIILVWLSGFISKYLVKLYE